MATAFLHPYDITSVASKSGNCRDLSANSIKLFIEKFNSLAGSKKLHYSTASEARSEMTMAAKNKMFSKDHDIFKGNFEFLAPVQLLLQASQEKKCFRNERTAKELATERVATPASSSTPKAPSARGSVTTGAQAIVTALINKCLEAISPTKVLTVDITSTSKTVGKKNGAERTEQINEKGVTKSANTSTSQGPPPPPGADLTSIMTKLNELPALDQLMNDIRSETTKLSDRIDNVQATIATNLCEDSNFYDKVAKPDAITKQVDDRISDKIGTLATREELSELKNAQQSVDAQKLDELGIKIEYNKYWNASVQYKAAVTSMKRQGVCRITLTDHSLWRQSNGAFEIDHDSVASALGARYEVTSDPRVSQSQNLTFNARIIANSAAATFHTLKSIIDNRANLQRRISISLISQYTHSSPPSRHITNYSI